MVFGATSNDGNLDVLLLPLFESFSFVADKAPKELLRRTAVRGVLVLPFKEVVSGVDGTFGIGSIEGRTLLSNCKYRRLNKD